MSILLDGALEKINQTSLDQETKSHYQQILRCMTPNEQLGYILAIDAYTPNTLSNVLKSLFPQPEESKNPVLNQYIHAWF